MKKLWIFLGLVALIAGPAGAGVLYEIEVTDHGQSPPKSESIQVAVEGGNLKIGIASGGRGKQGEMIFRGDRHEMIVIDHDGESYHVMDKEALGQIAGQVKSAMSQMQEALENVPEEQRAMIERMMKQRMPKAAAPIKRPRSEIRKTSERDTKNGYPCVRYEVLRGGTKIRELWVTDWDNIEGGADVVDAFEDMADFFREMLDAIPDFGQGGRAGGNNVFEHMKELGGFPVVTKDFNDDGSLESETVLRSAKRRTIDPDAFEPPSGYKRQEMFGGR